ncbi:hypothetical protein V5H98_01850 [Georgenia sp. M64]|uniref:hypothetical protein n=1 Tax=Georgenia sp. M64 TaxID=3120520 RepID=UPI0030DE482B
MTDESVHLPRLAGQAASLLREAFKSSQFPIYGLGAAWSGSRLLLGAETTETTRHSDAKIMAHAATFTLGYNGQNGQSVTVITTTESGQSLEWYLAIHAFPAIARNKSEPPERIIGKSSDFQHLKAMVEVDGSEAAFDVLSHRSGAFVARARLLPFTVVVVGKGVSIVDVRLSTILDFSEYSSSSDPI